MDFQEFGDILRKIDKTLIRFRDVFYPGSDKNERGILDKYTVLAPYYSKASELNQEIMEIREKSTELENELEEFHKTLPNYSKRRTYTQKPLPFLVTICGNKFNEEIFFGTLEHYGRDNFVAIFNKTIKEYIENKIALDKINKIEHHKIDKYQQQIIKLDTWFNEFDFVPDKIKSFIDEVKDQITPDNKESFIPKQNELEMQKSVSSETNEPDKGKEDFYGYIYGLADEMRDRKEKGEFETYRDAYRYAEKNITVNGKDITWNKLEKNYDKAKSAGKLD